MIDYTPFITSIADTELAPWAKLLPEQITEGLSEKRFGDIGRWLQAIAMLPSLEASQVDLKHQVLIGGENDASEAQRQQLEQALRSLCPWRKGPYSVFGIAIDTEWRSDWKWQRLLPHIAPLQYRSVLDVGCGNGYHCWRMAGEQAKQVIGIDPSPRFIVQFYMLKKYLPTLPVNVLPVGIQDVPENLKAFDTTFSMGVLYHRRSPMDHLRQLRDTLKPGGELVLETLIIEGKAGEVLVPEDRYAKMSNVWFIPSIDSLLLWLRKSGFDNARCVDASKTSFDEQRQTSWVASQSLEHFLDPNDSSRTVEGYPAPLRAIFIANRK